MHVKAARVVTHHHFQPKNYKPMILQCGLKQRARFVLKTEQIYLEQTNIQQSKNSKLATFGHIYGPIFLTVAAHIFCAPSFKRPAPYPN